MAGTSVDHAHDTHEHDTDHDGMWEGAKPPFKASYGKLMMWYFLVSDAFTFAGFLIAYGALRFSSFTWPEPDWVFTSFPFASKHLPLIFVTFMTFVLIISSVTMVRAVQEGHRENQRGVVFWMLMTVLGGATFLGSQAYEWTTLIVKEQMTVGRNPFGRHEMSGAYITPDGKEIRFDKGDNYTLHHIHDGVPEGLLYMSDEGKVEELHGTKTKYDLTESETKAGKKPEVISAPYGPPAFGALFFFITGFHGFHVFSGVLFLSIIAINAASGLYARRKNGYEMVEKIGLYWHFVDLVWVFVFLVFYLL